MADIAVVLFRQRLRSLQPRRIAGNVRRLRRRQSGKRRGYRSADAATRQRSTTDGALFVDPAVHVPRKHARRGADECRPTSSGDQAGPGLRLSDGRCGARARDARDYRHGPRSQTHYGAAKGERQPA